MFTSIMLCLLLDHSNLKELNLENLDIFQYNAMTIHRLAYGYLISSDFDNVLCIVNHQGEMLARFDQAGAGPQELNRQVVLHVDESEILVVTNHRHIIKFNHDLIPQESYFTPIPHGIWGGAKLRNDHFVVLSSRATSFALKEFWFAQGQWESGNRGFPTLADPQTRINTHFLRYQNGYGFYYNAAIQEKDEYLVEVHDLRQSRKENVVQILSAPIDDLPDRERAKVFLSSSYRYKGGYIAFLVVRSLPKYDFKAAWVDYFSGEGQFLKRFALNKYAGIIPVQNSDEIFEINQETMVIRSLQLKP